MAASDGSVGLRRLKLRRHRTRSMCADPHKQQFPPVRCAPVGMTDYFNPVGMTDYFNHFRDGWLGGGEEVGVAPDAPPAVGAATERG